MYRLALIQNQSEMAHYGYADAQPMLTDLGYSPTLFTGHNLHLLPTPLKDHFDALVIASNAMNDRLVFEQLVDGPLRGDIESFLLAGGGVVCLHQLGLARLDREPKLPFLPDLLRSVAPTRRPPNERATDGNLGVPPGVAGHVLVVYPNHVDAAALQSMSRGFRGLPGVYWHYWSGIDLARWDVLVVDERRREAVRPLVVVSKESDPGRVVLSSLPLDWQRGRELLENIVVYAAEGRHSTAVVVDSRSVGLEVKYLIKILESERFPFRLYSLGDGTGQLVQHVRDQVHTTLLLTERVTQETLEEPLRTTVTAHVRDGKLRLLCLGGADAGASRFYIESRHRYAVRLLHRVDLLVQGELWRGYIDGSLWSTAETLRTLAGLGTVPARGEIEFDRLTDKILDEIDDHDRDGSYDETFGATCAALWIRAAYLGRDHPKTASSVQWIRRRVASYESRERALAYQTFADCGVLSGRDRQELVAVFDSLDHARLTQSDVVSYLRAALAARHVPALPALVARTVELHDSQDWIDLSTAAEAGYLLCDAEDLLRQSVAVVSPEAYESLRRTAAEIVILIQAGIDANSSGDVYPWGRKASTSARCVRTWLTFDAKLESPVYEVVEKLVTDGRVSVQQASGRTALTVLEQLKDENDALVSRLRDEQTTDDRARRAMIRARVFLVLAVVMLYLLVAILAGSTTNGGKSFSALLSDTFVQPWGFHLAIASLLTAAVAVPWSQWFRDRR